MARPSIRPQIQVVLELHAPTLELRIGQGGGTCRQPKRATACGLPEGWRPSHEDEAFALRHGMNPKGVVHALRQQRRIVSANGGTPDWSAIFRDWVAAHAIEAPIIFPLF